MEKLLDIKGKGDFYKLYRFQCDCLMTEEAMDIDVECNGDNEKFLTIRLDFWDVSLWKRLKFAYQIFIGRWTWREFIPRSEDYGNISDIFNPDKGYNDLP